MGIRSDSAHMHFLRVLLVEDDRDTRDATAAWLLHLGHEVHIAADGRTALEVAEAIRPDVVLLDLGLAGMDGWEVARQLRKDPSATRPYIVAVTGRGDREDYSRSRQVGIDLHMTKPADPEELGEVLHRFHSLLAS
jgi:CheY-like chemotaxis protein